MTRSICINLSAAEAKAWAAGATCLIRPAIPFTKEDRLPAHALMALSGSGHGCKWTIGDVLIGREAWMFVGTDMMRLGRTRAIQDGVVEYRDGKRETFTLPWQDVERWMTRRPDAWRSAATMPAALARHRRRVVSVRVCMAATVSGDEVHAAGYVGWMPMVDEIRVADPAAYVSVTMLEPAPGKEGS